VDCCIFTAALRPVTSFRALFVYRPNDTGDSAFRRGDAHHPSTIHCGVADDGVVGYDDAAAGDRRSETHAPRGRRIGRVPGIGAVYDR